MRQLHLHLPAGRHGTAAGLAIAALLLGTAARAQVTPEQVWQSWNDYYTSMGQSITTGSQTRDGDTLVLGQVAIGATMPGGSLNITVGDVRMRDAGDGTVEVSFAPEMPVTINNKAKSGETVDMAMKVAQTGMSMIVSGTPENMSYAVAAPDLRFGVDSMKVDGAEVPLTATVALTGTTGTYNVTAQGGQTIASDFKTDSVTFDLSAKDPKGTGTFSAKGNLSGISGTSKAVIPDGVDMTDMNAALGAGFDASGSFTVGSGTYAVDLQEPGQSMSAKVEGEGGNLNFAMSKAGLTYGGGGKATRMNVTASQLPFPIEMGYGETAFNLVMPVMKGEAPQPVALLVKVVDLTLSDTIWGMIDAGNQLPRDPATLVVDLSGMAKLTADIMDPALADTAAPPGEIESVNLAQLLVRAVGAELVGSGAVTVDNSQGVPKPVGAVDLKLTGANALLDKLVAMGLLPQDQAMGARMMLGLFAVPSGDDILTSKIEFRDDGGIYANGQRLQ